MVQLQVETGKGITFAIRDGLKNQGVDVSSIDANTWNSIMTEVSSENDTKKSNGKKELYYWWKRFIRFYKKQLCS